MMPYFIGMSRPVITAWTPSMASASPASMERMRAWGCGLLRIFPWSMPGKTRSSVKCACPVDFSRPSTFLSRDPITVKSD